MSARWGTLLLAVLISAWAGPVLPYERPTHQEITEQAVLRSRLDQILKTELDLPQGVATTLASARADRWVEIGADREDVPFGRVLNHFHNPLRDPWETAGLDLPFLPDGRSSVLWQQEPDPLAGFWAWPAARRRHLESLTLPDPGARETRLAELMRTLGQMMHLVQDATVPAHVRDDPHPPVGSQKDGYEGWVDRERTNRPDQFRSLISAPPDVPANGIFTPTGHPLAPVPVARLIDTDRFNGTDPSLLGGTELGTAEFTNGNFLSQGRMFGAFALPRRSALGPGVNRIDEDGKTRRYFPKLGDGAIVERFVAESLLLGPASEEVGLPPDESFELTQRVYESYAEVLLPRAVGYSTALIDYFFRGKLGVAFTDDPNGTVLTVMNLSGEPIGPGTLGVYADDPSGRRELVPGASVSLSAPVPRGGSLPVVPLGTAAVGRLTVVYRGQMGGEPDAVAGRVLSALPLEQVFRGETDWMLRTAQGIFPLGLGLGPDEVKWGERDNTLVTATFLAGSDAAFAAYQIARPEGSSDVPLRPDGAVDLVPIGSASLSGPAIDLQTTFSLQRNEHIGQQIALVDRQFISNTSPAQVQYSLAAAVPRDLGSFPFSRAFPLVMRLPDEGNESYGWFAPRAFLNREGAIHAVVQVSLFGLLSEDLACWRHLGDTAGTISLILIGGRSPCFFFVHHDLPIPLSLGSMPFLVNLTNRSLVAKATADAVAVTYETTRDQWSVDIREVGLDGTVGCCQWVDGAGIGLNEGGPVAGEFAIRDQIVNLAMTGFHGPAFSGVGFANRALVEAPSTAVVPVIPANLSVTPGLSLGVTTQRRFSCPDTTVIEDVDTLRGAGAEYMALGKTLCGLDAPAQYTPVRWDPANGRATRFASFEIPLSSVVIMTGANEAAAMILARNVGSPSTTFLATPTQALVFPGDLSSQYRLLESGVLLNLETFRVHDIDPALTPVRALEPLAAGGPAEGEYHLVRAR